MKHITILLAVALTGCAAPVYRQSSSAGSASDQALAACKYDAAKATASIRSGLEQGYMMATLTKQCMASKGFTAN